MSVGATILKFDDLIDRKTNTFKNAASPALPTSFAFTWKEIAFKVEILDEEDNQKSIEIKANLGTMPFTAQDSFARIQIMRLSALAALDEHGLFSISAQGEVDFISTTTLASKSEMPELIAELTALLVRARPRLIEMRKLLKAARR